MDQRVLEVETNRQTAGEDEIRVLKLAQAELPRPQGCR